MGSKEQEIYLRQLPLSSNGLSGHQRKALHTCFLKKDNLHLHTSLAYIFYTGDSLATVIYGFRVSFLRLRNADRAFRVYDEEADIASSRHSIGTLASVHKGYVHYLLSLFST